MESKILKIIFLCEDDKQLTITLATPKDDITGEEITAFSDDFIDCGIFGVKDNSGFASVTELKEAYYLETTYTPIYGSEPELKKGGNVNAN